MSIRPYLLIAATLIPGVLALAQEPSGDLDVLRVDTRLVQVDVVVRDDDGAVRDLSADDFTLYDNGVEQTIALFERTAIEDAGPAAGVDAADPRFVTNRLAPDGGTPASATVILVDRLNTGVIQQARATEQAVKFLESLDPRHRVAIYELGTRLSVVHGYSNDRASLIAALTGDDSEVTQALDASSGPGITGGFEAEENEIGLDPILAQAQANPGGGLEAIGTLALDREVSLYYREGRIEQTAAALETIAGQLAFLVGRKNLVWIAGSFPFTFDPFSYFPLSEIGYDVKNRLVRAGQIIHDADMAIYPISTQGLAWPPAMETMRNVAEATGGQAFYMTNGIAEAIQTAVDDTEWVYTLGYYPGPSAEDDAFHQFRVEVVRDDVQVRHRRGYYGFASEARAAGENLGQIYRDLVTSPTNATELGLSARTEAIDPGSGTVTTVVLDLNDVGLDYTDSLWTGEIGLATVIVEPGDEAAEVQVGTLEFVLTDEEYAAGREAGYALFRLRSYDAGAGQLRVVVRDPETGATGSLWVTLD